MFKKALFFSVLACALTLSAKAQTDTSTATGIWYVNANGFRLDLRFTPRSDGSYEGVRLTENGNIQETFDSVSWNPSTRTIEWRRNIPGLTQWYRAKIVEGVMNGRYTSTPYPTEPNTKPADLFKYQWHITGWSQNYLTQALAPCVFDIETQPGFRARLRIDKGTSPGTFLGKLKHYALGATVYETIEEDVTIQTWNGGSLTFIRNPQTSSQQTYTGAITNRYVNGTFSDQSGSYTWKGVKVEVLGYGFTPKGNTTERLNWQSRTRKQLQHLMMAGNPISPCPVTCILVPNIPPLSGTPASNRDDNYSSFPQNYGLSHFCLNSCAPNPFNNEVLVRQINGYLAKPTTPQPSGGYPLVVALNGHGGSAKQVFTPNSTDFWYGDAFARRGYMVLAIDISHRPPEDKILIGNHPANRLGYEQAPPVGGDNPADGNGYHSSIRPTTFSSYVLPSDYKLFTDWEEDGERTWDVMRAIDYALSRGDVNPSKIIVTGVSMGGEIAAFVAAFDPRIACAIPAGFSPDLNVLKFRGSHGCWNWHYSDIREYIDASDLSALVAPRSLMIQTGKMDTVYSGFNPPFASDKQVARRIRSAYFNNEQGKFIHYLHYDVHRYHFGEIGQEMYVRVPTNIAPTMLFGDYFWQYDSATYAPIPQSVLGYISNWLSP